MKTHAKQPNNSTPDKAPGSNQAPTGSILQAYKTSGNQPIAQLRAYSQTFIVQQDIDDNDLHDWGTMRQKLGIPKKGSAAGAAGSNAKTSLTALGIAGTDSPMTAHMIPRRAGEWETVRMQDPGLTNLRPLHGKTALTMFLMANSKTRRKMIL